MRKLLLTTIPKEILGLMTKAQYGEGIPSPHIKVNVQLQSVSIFGVVITMICGIIGLLVGVILFTGKTIKGNIQDAKEAIKEMSEMETLPPKVKKFHESLPVRAFRVIGGLCSIFTFAVYGSGYEVPIMIYVLTRGMTSLLVVYVLVISTIDLHGSIKNARKGKLITRNSPVNWVKTVYKCTIQGGKWACTPFKYATGFAGGALIWEEMAESIGFNPPIKTYVKPKVRAGLEHLGISWNGEGVKILNYNKSVETGLKESKDQIKTISEILKSDHVKNDPAATELYSELLKEAKQQETKLVYDQTKVAEMVRANQNKINSRGLND